MRRKPEGRNPVVVICIKYNVTWHLAGIRIILSFHNKRVLKNLNLANICFCGLWTELHCTVYVLFNITM